MEFYMSHVAIAKSLKQCSLNCMYSKLPHHCCQNFPMTILMYFFLSSHDDLSLCASDKHTMNRVLLSTNHVHSPTSSLCSCIVKLYRGFLENNMVQFPSVRLLKFFF